VWEDRPEDSGGTGVWPMKYLQYIIAKSLVHIGEFFCHWGIDTAGKGRLDVYIEVEASHISSDIEGIIMAVIVFIGLFIFWIITP
jgi:hypothetical protein